MRNFFVIGLVLLVSGWIGSPVIGQIQVEGDFQAGLFHTNMEISRTLNRGYVGSGFVGQVDVIDLDTNQPIGAMAAAGGGMVSLSPDERYVMVSTGSRDYPVYRTSDNLRETTVPLSVDLATITGGIGWSPDSAFAFILRVPTSPSEDTTLHKIDAETFQEVDRLTLSGGAVFSSFFFAIAPAGSRAIVNAPFASPPVIRVVDLDTLSVVSNVDIGIGAFKPVFSADGKTMWIASGATDTVSVIDLSDGSVLSTLATGRGPSTLAIDEAGRRLAVGCGADDTVQIFDLDTEALLTTISTPENSGLALIPHTGFGLVPATNLESVYVIDVDPASVDFGTVVQTFVPPGCTGTCSPFEVVLHPNLRTGYLLSGNLLRVDVLGLPKPPLSIYLVPHAFRFAAGQRVLMSATVTNNTTTAMPVTGWLEVIKPNGLPFGGNPVLGPKTKSLAPGQSITRTVGYRIGATVPPSGPYRTVGSVGVFPNGPVSTSSFPYLVTD